MKRNLIKLLMASVCCIIVFFLMTTFAYAEDNKKSEVMKEANVLKTFIDDFKPPVNLLLEEQTNFIDKIRKFVAVGLQKKELEKYNDYYFSARSCYSEARIQLSSVYSFLDKGYPDIAREYLDRCREYIKMGKLYDDAAMEVWMGNLESASEKLYEVGKVSTNIAGLSGKILGKIPGCYYAGQAFDKGSMAMEYWLDVKYKDSDTAKRNALKSLTDSVVNEAYAGFLTDKLGIDITDDAVDMTRSVSSILGLNIPGFDAVYEEAPDVFCSDTCKLVRKLSEGVPEGEKEKILKELEDKTGSTPDEVKNLADAFNTINADNITGRYYPVKGQDLESVLEELAGKLYEGSSINIDAINDYVISMIDYIEFRNDGKAVISIMGMSTGAYDYEVRGDSVYVRDPQNGDAVFRIVDENTLLGETTGLIGIFKSKAVTDDNKENADIRQYFMQMLSQGKAEELEFGIGSSISDIINKWGKPDSEGDFAGGVYCEYNGKALLFYDRYSGSVTNMAFVEGETFNGIKIGSSVKEIINILGEPSDEYTAGEGNELAESENDWVVSYHSGNYLVEFYTKSKDGDTYAAYLWRK